MLHVHRTWVNSRIWEDNQDSDFNIMHVLNVTFIFQPRMLVCQCINYWRVHCLRERSMCLKASKESNHIPCGDRETWLWYSISEPKTGIRIQCQNIQQHQGRRERRAMLINLRIFFLETECDDSLVAPRGRMFIWVCLIPNWAKHIW